MRFDIFPGKESLSFIANKRNLIVQKKFIMLIFVIKDFLSVIYIRLDFSFASHRIKLR